MSTFADVNPGEHWRPEPAARYNAVNRIVNRYDAGGEAAGDVPSAVRGAVIVTAAVTASLGGAEDAYSVVALGSAPADWSADLPTNVVFSVAGAASSDAAVWGVTQAPAVSGGTVPVMLQGVTPVRLVSGATVSAGESLAPASGGMIAVGAGMARSLFSDNGGSGGLIVAQLGGFGGGGAAPGYSGYFTLSVAASGSGYAVTIADGATGSASTAVVNGGVSWSIPPYSESVAGDRVFFLKYTPAVYNSGGGIVSSATLVISSLGSQTSGTFPVLPSGGTSGAYYMQLGRCLWNSGAPRVIQDHTAGVAEFNWFVNCNLYAT